MDKKMNFKYFYGTEADQFSFYRIPKALFTNECFKDLSSDAKILYGLMLDRMSFKSGRKSVVDSIVVYHFDYRCWSEAASTYGGNRKKDIGIGNYGVVHRNSDLLSRLATGSFSGLYGRCSNRYFICWRIYRCCS